ncbi:plasmid partitioning protein ParF [Burkholderia multivorans]|uniref:portal protein n=1 Tax=Burkholderia multivorans TaxID=87883 RepID=UPI00207D22EF|nr:plasmid partitioning protein ParF [Burkholderia multivorans]MCO1461202.1 plasmid partitioning protein ParF [Burkholderia multivorans]
MNQDELMNQVGMAMMPDTNPSDVAMVPAPVQVVESIGSDDEPRGANRMSDETISSILDAHIRSAEDWIGSEIQQQQAKAMEYYFGDPEGDLAPPEVADRSDIVDTVVSDQVEWLMPTLMEIFYASGDPVRFTPTKAGDEDAADQMTMVVNHVVNVQNPGFQIFEDWFKSALLTKYGVVKAWWQVDTTDTRETYQALTDIQLAILTQDPDVVVTSVETFVDPQAERAAMSQYQQQVELYQAQQAGQQLPPGPDGSPAPQLPPPQPINIEQLPRLHNVVLTRSKKAGHVAIEAVMPEDFLVSSRSRRLRDGFCAHRVRKTLSDLKAEGYENIDLIDSEPNALAADLSELALARQNEQNRVVTNAFDDGFGDDSQREVELYECYLPIDVDGDGISEWRKITKAGNAILDNEVVDGPPFALVSPISIPGLLIGRSIADLAMPIQRIKTKFLRGLDDNMQIQINGRVGLVTGEVEISDWLNNRPGGAVRCKRPGAIFPIQQGITDTAGVMQLLQYVDAMSQERTGITKYSQGLDADTLNHTADGIKRITARADLRVKMIARKFAETGVTDLFRLIQKLLMQHQDKPMSIALSKGKWVDIDPRVWRNQYSMKVVVGTGTGDMAERVAHLMQLFGMQQTLAQSQNPQIAGMVTPQNLQRTVHEIVKALQLGEPSMFVSDPPPPPPAPPAPPPDPQTQLIAGQIQVEREKAHLKQQTDAAKIELDARLQKEHERLLDARERDVAAQKLAWEREKFYASLAAERERAAFSAKITDPSVERAMNDSIQQDQQQEQAQALADQERIAWAQMNNGGQPA